MKPSLNLVAKLQGVYWFLTGVWPFLHLPSFLWVTGPKEDIWLMYSVSVFLVVTGAGLLLAGFRRRVTPELKWMAITAAAGLTGIDVYYALSDVIWDIYLLDAAGELVIILLWLWAGSKGLMVNKKDV